MRTERSLGTHVTWTNTTGLAVVSGQLVAVGANGVGIASADIANLASGDVAVAGEHEVAKTVAEVWAQGDVLWLVNATGMLSNAAGNEVAGIAAKAAIQGATTGNVILTHGLVSVPGAGTVTAAMLANAVADRILTGTVAAAAEIAHARVITVQLKDAQGNNLAEQRLIRLLVNSTGAAAAGNAPAATATDTFGAPSAGAILVTHTAKADYEVVTDATGKYVFELTHNDAGGSRYIDVFADSKPISSGAIAFDAV